MSNSSTPNGSGISGALAASQHLPNGPTPNTDPPRPQPMPVRSLPNFPHPDSDVARERPAPHFNLLSSLNSRLPNMSLPDVNQPQFARFNPDANRRPTLGRSYGFIFDQESGEFIHHRPASSSDTDGDNEFPLPNRNPGPGIGALCAFPRAGPLFSSVPRQKVLPFIGHLHEDKIYTRFCPVCRETDVGVRAVYTACGHCSCYRCARQCTLSIHPRHGGVLPCPVCRTPTTVIQLFED